MEFPIIKEPGSSLENKTGNWKAVKPTKDLKKCTNCGICWVFCPEGAVKKGEKGLFFVDEGYCKGCGICADQCPFGAIEMIEI